MEHHEHFYFLFPHWNVEECCWYVKTIFKSFKQRSRYHTTMDIKVELQFDFLINDYDQRKGNDDWFNWLEELVVRQ